MRLMAGFCLLLIPFICFSDQDFSPENKPAPFAQIEIGADSNERRYVRPFLRFEFPVRKGFIFSEVDYYQRIDSQLRGEVDFWLKAGLEYVLTQPLSLEASLNHFCRHTTSRSFPIVLDMNEVLGRLWHRRQNIKIGLGGGFYIGGDESYDNLLVMNFSCPHILRTEFGIESEFKWINFTKVLHDLEFFISLNENLDLFVRNTVHYEYDNTTYLGMRFKSGGPANDIIRKLMFETVVFPSYERHKAESILGFDLEIFKNRHRRLQITLNSRIPILRDHAFLAAFQPEVIEYPLSLQYERKINEDLLALVYCLYRAIMPVDVDQRFTSSLGTGVGLRNQPFFDKLDKKVRFEVFGGYNFAHTYDAGAQVGFNTVGRPLNLGVEVRTMFNPNEFVGGLTIFGEFGKGIKIRGFIGGETTHYFVEEHLSENKWLFGVSLFSWF